MDLNSLSLLVEILEAGNLSEAARRLEMTRANVASFLQEAKQMHGSEVLIDGGTRFVEMAKEVAASRPDLGVTVKTTPAYEASRAAKQERNVESSRSAPTAR